MKILSHGLMFSLLFVLASVSTQSQDLDDITIYGRIVDSNNLPIVGATVDATHVGSNIGRTIITDEDGRYRFIELRPGVYKVRAVATGFGPKEFPGIETISGQNVKLDISMSPAEVTAETTISVSS